MYLIRLSLLFMLLLPLAMQAQPTPQAITGVVLDHVTQEPVVGASALLLSTGIGVSTDINGRFVLPNVPIGTYQLRASAVGYLPLVLSDIVVAVGKPTNIVAQLHQVAIDLEGVEVIASYFQKSPDAPVSVQQLSYEEIRRSPGGFEDVVRAVSVLPGVAQAQAGRNDLVVRGGAPSENLFVLDNIEIPNINHFGTQGASGGPLSFINLDFVRETSFSTGGFGVRYGDRLSSVLEIQLQDGRTDRLGGKGTISASQFGANLQGPLGKESTFLFSARRSYLDLIFKASGFSFVPEYWDFLGRATYAIDKSNTLTFLGVGAIDNVLFFDDDAKDRFDNSRVLGTDQRQYAVGSSWRHLHGNGYSTLTLSRTYVKYNSLQRDSLLNPVFTNLSTESETTLRGDVVMQASKNTEISFGLQGKRIGFDATIGLPNYVTPFGDTLDVSVSGYSTTWYKSAAYAQVSRNLLPNLSITLGGRVDYFSLIGKKFSVVPRGSLAFDLSDLTTLTASAGIYYQTPSYVWLVANPANRDLSATRVTQYIVGLEHLLRVDTKIRIEGFLKEYSDYPASINRGFLVLANTGGGYGGADENFASFGLDNLVSAGKGRSRGLELLVQKKLSEIPLYGLISVTLSKTTFTALDGIERPGAFDQQVLANLSAGYQFNENWEASMKFRFSSGQPYTPFNPDGTQNVSAYNSLRVRNNHSLDLRVDRRWNFSNWNLITYVDIQNIYNNKFTGSVRWNARERKAEADEGSIGILPSIGISAEF